MQVVFFVFVLFLDIWQVKCFILKRKCFTLLSGSLNIDTCKIWLILLTEMFKHDVKHNSLSLGVFYLYHCKSWSWIQETPTHLKTSGSPQMHNKRDRNETLFYWIIHMFISQFQRLINTHLRKLLIFNFEFNFLHTSY